MSEQHLTDTAISITDLIGGVAGFGKQALPVARFVAGFIPGAGPVLTVIEMAQPILEKIAAAAPVVAGALDKGRPIFEAVETAGPGVLADLKSLFALAVNHDPARSETDANANDVTDEQAMSFAGTIFQRSYFTPQDPRFEHGSIKDVS